MFDLTRLAYVARARREALGLNMRQVRDGTGIGLRQLSWVEHGRAINAGSTWMLMRFYRIDPAEMLEPDAKARLDRIREKSGMGEAA